MRDPLLELSSLSVGYGEGLVIEDMSIVVETGRSLAVLGRNGVGKTTMMLAIAGHLRPQQGCIRVAGQDVTRRPAYGRVGHGLAWVPQERAIFPSLTVEEHLLIARRKGEWTLDRVYGIFPRLRERRKSMGSKLSGGEQQMLAIGRALIINPILLLLDEPLEGLAPVIVHEVAACIRRLAEESGLTIILVEQNIGLALELTDSVIVLDKGSVVHRGLSKTHLNDPSVLEDLVGVAH